MCFVLDNTDSVNLVKPVINTPVNLVKPVINTPANLVKPVINTPPWESFSLHCNDTFCVHVVYV